MSRGTNLFKTGLILGLLTLTGLPVAAQNVNDPGIQERELKQQQRIQQGIKSGQLTPGEATRLENQQSRIKATEDRMKADGKLTPGERARLTQRQNCASRNIYRKKHNNQVAQ
jgi:hypothetical protein